METKAEKTEERGDLVDVQAGSRAKAEAKVAMAAAAATAMEGTGGRRRRQPTCTYPTPCILGARGLRTGMFRKLCRRLGPLERTPMSTTEAARVAAPRGAASTAGATEEEPTAASTEEARDRIRPFRGRSHKRTPPSRPSDTPNSVQLSLCSKVQTEEPSVAAAAVVRPGAHVAEGLEAAPLVAAPVAATAGTPSCAG